MQLEAGRLQSTKRDKTFYSQHGTGLGFRELQTQEGKTGYVQHDSRRRQNETGPFTHSMAGVSREWQQAVLQPLPPNQSCDQFLVNVQKELSKKRRYISLNPLDKDAETDRHGGEDVGLY